MKRSFFAAIFFFSLLALNAQEQPLAFTLTTDAAYHPQSAYEPGESHFSALDGWYRSAKIRTRFDASYTVPCMVRDNALQENNHLTMTAGFELTPVSVLPQVSVTFSPAALLEFAVGGMAGTGWGLGSFADGIAEYQFSAQKYETLTPFATWYLCGWASATIQFDVAALWPGEWHHIVALAEYTVGYETLTGTNATVWSWRTNRGMADGWVYKQYYVIGYQMPLRLSMVALTAELAGHYDADDYGAVSRSYDGDFMSVTLSPTLQWSLTEKDDLYLVGNISARRSFSAPHDDEDEEPLLTTVGREWFFDYIAVRWVHRF